MAPLIEELKKQDLINQLTWNESVNSNDIFVSVTNGMVILQGKVPSYTAKLSAEHSALRVEGVNQVENLLEVAFPAQAIIPSDKEIAKNISETFLLDSRINSTKIEVEVKNGEVALSGIVGSNLEKYAANEIAITSKGVKGVMNKIAVSLTDTVVDLELISKIKNVFDNSILIESGKITVEANNGVVRLSGSVANNLIKKEAYDLAFFTKGVVEVINDIAVE